MRDRWNNIARQLEGRVAYQSNQDGYRFNHENGCRRYQNPDFRSLNSAEMARAEIYKEGRIPLHTFRADIDFTLRLRH